MSKDLSHVDKAGNPQMVDVSEKPITRRKAVARSEVWLGEPIIELIENGELTTRKGPVFQTAIIAGTMGAKKTSELIPFCHPLDLDDCKISIQKRSEHVEIICTVRTEGKTGVEMEALTGASVAALTVYDMCKALSHNINIKETVLVEKTGGKNDYKLEDNG